MKSAEELKENVRNTYAQVASQSKEANASSCCGAGDCSTEVYNIMSDDYAGLEGYTADADLGWGCGLPTETAGIKTGDTVLTSAAAQATTPSWRAQPPERTVA